MNRAQIRARAYELTGLQASDPLAQVGMVNRHIDSALRTVAADHDWPWLIHESTINLVGGTGDYPAPTGWVKTVDLAITQGSSLGPLTYISTLALDELYIDQAQQGSPRHYSISGDLIRLRPIPDGAGLAVHRWKSGEPELVLDTDSPEMPPEYHDQLVELVAAMMLGSTRDARSGEYWQRYTAWARRLRDEQSRKVGAHRIRVRPGGWV